MKTYLDCFPCFVKQALKAGRRATDDQEVIKKLIDRVGDMLKDIPLETTPPETGEIIYNLVREYTGIDDPFKKIKQQNIQEALSLMPYLRKLIKESDDPLMTAVRIAIAGNVMDMGVNLEYKIEKDLDIILNQDFGIFDFEKFKTAIQKADSVLYLGDNAGESVFDRILIEEIRKPVVYVVRDKPVINDATYEDAIASGLDSVAEIISNGSSAPGTILKTCSKEFVERFKAAELIISKGQGNYEGLSENEKQIFFLLKAKCEIIANDLGVKLNDIVLKASL